MLDRPTQQDIVATVQTHWEDKCRGGHLAEYMARKERGHGLADWVEYETVALLEQGFGPRAAYETKKGSRRARSMGDIWLECGGIFNPVNVKTGVKDPGESGSSGQPNLVSLGKLTYAVFNRWIDSYYLLFVRFVASEPPTVAVSLADLLHIVEDYAHFDAGTGQLMLKSRKFDDPPKPSYDIVDPKVALEHLVETREDGNRRLMRKRERDLAALRAQTAGFDGSVPINQEDLELEAAG